MDLIKTYEEACKIEGIDPVANLPYADPKTGDQKALNAAARLFVEIRVLNKQVNGGKPWVADWTNPGQRKYEPWADLSSGSGLSYYDFVNDASDSSVGSRLCYIDDPTAEYGMKTFKSDYEDLMLVRD